MVLLKNRNHPALGFPAPTLRHVTAEAAPGGGAPTTKRERAAAAAGSEGRVLPSARL